MDELQTTGYRIYRETNVTAAQAALAEGFTTTVPANVLTTEGHRGARIILLGSPSGGTCAEADVYAVDTVDSSRDPKGYFITKIGTTSAITFSGAISTDGRSPNLRVPTVLATYTEDASWTPRRTYATGNGGFGVPVVNVGPYFELLISELGNPWGIVIQFEGAFGGSLANANAYVCLDI